MQKQWLVGVVVVVALAGAYGVWNLSGRSVDKPSASEVTAAQVSPWLAKGAGDVAPPAVSRERAVDAVNAPVSPVARREPEGKRRAYDRARADAVRERAAALRAEAAPPASGTSLAAWAEAAPTPQTEEQRRRQYLNMAVREQYIPIATSCYEELLARHPKAEGKVVLSFAIVGDGTDGVVDRVEVADETTMNDPELVLCLRESMYTTVFEPPPPGAEETTVVYPLELRPD